MSRFDWLESAVLEGAYGFETLIMAAMRQANVESAEKLRAAFPEIWAELQARNNAPRGHLPEGQREPPRRA